MDSAWLITTAGLATAAIGLYVLITAPRGRWSAPTQVGAALVFLGAAASAASVLQPTGLFMGLLAFALVSAGAMAGLIIVLVARRTESAWQALGAMSLCLAGVIAFRGVGADAIAVAGCGLAAGTVGWLRRRSSGESSHPAASAHHAERREPLLACMAWGGLVWGLLRSLAFAAASPAAALINNQLAVGSVIFAGGLLALFVSHAPERAALGLAAATLGLVVLLSACAALDPRSESVYFGTIVLAAGVAQTAGIVWLARPTPELSNASRPSLAQDGPVP
jgi:hypothetical protein